jgi:hypothetical protein
LHPPIPLLLKALKKFQEERKIAILIVPSWPSMDRLIILTIPVEKSENVLINGRLL